LFTNLLTFWQPLLLCSERFLFAAMLPAVIAMRKLVGPFVSVHQLVLHYVKFKVKKMPPKLFSHVKVSYEKEAENIDMWCTGSGKVSCSFLMCITYLILHHIPGLEKS